MNIKLGFANALKKIRKARKLSQEDFSDVSSRTYLSTLERGLKSPTLEKVHELAKILEVHPITLLTMAYTKIDGKSHFEILDISKNEIVRIEELLV